MNNTEQPSQTRKTLIFTDLDGSLLDHFGYQVAPADRLLCQLESLDIPVIFCTSKTFSEVQVLREQLNNQHPFIVENGAAIYLPLNYFPGPLSGFKPSHHPDYLFHGFCEDRAHWLSLLSELKAEFPKQFISFSEMGTKGIMRASGLTETRAVLANQRQFSEPLQWLGDNAQKSRFINSMNQNGANIEQGGRFLHVIGNCDKGRALRFLRNQYQALQKPPITSVAIGDSQNDVTMLEAADKALLIRSPVHAFPVVKHEQLTKSQHYGPHGWVEGLNKILDLEKTSYRTFV